MLWEGGSSQLNIPVGEHIQHSLVLLLCLSNKGTVVVTVEYLAVVRVSGVRRRRGTSGGSIKGNSIDTYVKESPQAFISTSSYCSLWMTGVYQWCACLITSSSLFPIVFPTHSPLQPSPYLQEDLIQLVSMETISLEGMAEPHNKLLHLQQQVVVTTRVL